MSNLLSYRTILVILIQHESAQLIAERIEVIAQRIELHLNSFHPLQKLQMRNIALST